MKPEFEDFERIYDTGYGSLIVHVTNEGVIMDLYTDDTTVDQPVKTWGMMAEEWAEWLLVCR